MSKKVLWGGSKEKKIEKLCSTLGYFPSVLGLEIVAGLIAESFPLCRQFWCMSVFSCSSVENNVSWSFGSIPVGVREYFSPFIHKGVSLGCTPKRGGVAGAWAEAYSALLNVLTLLQCHPDSKKETQTPPLEKNFKEWATVFDVSRLGTRGGHSPHLPTTAVQYRRELTLSTNNILCFHPASYFCGLCVCECTHTRVCLSVHP